MSGDDPASRPEPNAFDADPYFDVPDAPSRQIPEQSAARPGRRKHVKKGGGLVSFLIELPVLILVALVVAVVIKTFFVQAFFIPSGSMIPTLEIDDRVMVNKLSYVFGEPERGDVVVFDSPFASVTDDQTFIAASWRAVKESLGIQTALVPDDLIKRIMALPGESIEIRENTVFIDGNPIDEPYLSPGIVMQDFGPQTIPDEMVFVMGDNRSSSQDSRKFGAISMEHIVGKAFVRLWPFDRFGSL
ncbi:MAG: signal peptidase I [Acidimicrobiia bacterium]|nr:signal peptidase I [Acidimicrobiia bacterium]